MGVETARHKVDMLRRQGFLFRQQPLPPDLLECFRSGAAPRWAPRVIAAREIDLRLVALPVGLPQGRRLRRGFDAFR